MTTNKKSLINGKTIFGAIIVALLAVVTVVLVVMNLGPKYNDDYFKSDDSKIVLAMYSEPSEDGKTPTTTYMVYYYTGEKIVDVKQFYKFDDEGKAKEVFDELKDSQMDWIAEKSLSGHYIIFKLTADQFEGLTTDMIRSSVESIEATEQPEANEPAVEETNE